MGDGNHAVNGHDVVVGFSAQLGSSNPDKSFTENRVNKESMCPTVPSGVSISKDSYCHATVTTQEASGLEYLSTSTIGSASGPPQVLRMTEGEGHGWLNTQTAPPNCEGEGSATSHSAGVFTSVQVDDYVRSDGNGTQRSADHVPRELRGGSYTTQPVIPEMCSMRTRLRPRHEIGGVMSQMNFNAWNYYLDFEENCETREYLRTGVLLGFPIAVDDDDNYKAILL